MKLPEIPEKFLQYAIERPGEIELHAPFIACVGGIHGHTDEMFDPWSAFMCIRNDGCRVWQRGGYKGIPRPGERFTLNIHKLHGVVAPRRGDGVLVLVHADARTEKAALRKLGTELRELRSTP